MSIKTHVNLCMHIIWLLEKSSECFKLWEKGDNYIELRDRNGRFWCLEIQFAKIRRLISTETPRVIWKTSKFPRVEDMTIIDCIFWRLAIWLMLRELRKFENQELCGISWKYTLSIYLLSAFLRVSLHLTSRTSRQVSCNRLANSM